MNLFDEHGDLILVIEIIKDQKSRVSGRIINDFRSPEMKSIFDQHSSYVNDQIFSALDELEQQIESMRINLRSGQAAITNIQIFDQAISFDKK